MSNITVIGIDIAKSVFQVCGLNRVNTVQFNKSVWRDKLVDSLLQYQGAVLAMEACDSSHHWARTFISLRFDSPPDNTQVDGAPWSIYPTRKVIVSGHVR